MRRATIYPTLWQPILTAGVPRDYAIVALILAAVVMGFANNRWVGFGLFGVLWLVGWFFAKLDPEFFSVLLQRMRLGRTKGSEDGNAYRA